MARKKGSTVRIKLDDKGRMKSMDISGPAANAFFHGLAKASEAKKPSDDTGEEKK